MGDSKYQVDGNFSWTTRGDTRLLITLSSFIDAQSRHPVHGRAGHLAGCISAEGQEVHKGGKLSPVMAAGCSAMCLAAGGGATLTAFAEWLVSCLSSCRCLTSAEYRLVHSWALSVLGERTFCGLTRTSSASQLDKYIMFIIAWKVPCACPSVGKYANRLASLSALPNLEIAWMK